MIQIFFIEKENGYGYIEDERKITREEVEKLNINDDTEFINQIRPYINRSDIISVKNFIYIMKWIDFNAGKISKEKYEEYWKFKIIN